MRVSIADSPVQSRMVLSPVQNGLLGALPDGYRQTLISKLELVQLPLCKVAAMPIA